MILFSLGIIGNIISGIFNPASTALIPHIVEPEQLQKANSYFTIKGALINILGVVLARNDELRYIVLGREPVGGVAIGIGSRLLVDRP